MGSSCSSDKSTPVHNETSVINHFNAKPQFEMLKIKLMEQIKEYNAKFGSPSYHSEDGDVYTLNYQTIMRQDANLFRKTILQFHQLKCMPVNADLLNDLDTITQIIKQLKDGDNGVYMDKHNNEPINESAHVHVQNTTVDYSNQNKVSNTR
jgi:hypothetical protein